MRSRANEDRQERKDEEKRSLKKRAFHASSGNGRSYNVPRKGAKLKLFVAVYIHLEASGGETDKRKVYIHRRKIHRGEGEKA